MYPSTIEKVRKALALIKDGVPKQKACKDTNLSLNTLYKFEKKQKKIAKKPRLETLAVEAPPPAAHGNGMIICLIGTPDAVVTALKAIL